MCGWTAMDRVLTQRGSITGIVRFARASRNGEIFPPPLRLGSIRCGAGLRGICPPHKNVRIADVCGQERAENYQLTEDLE